MPFIHFQEGPNAGQSHQVPEEGLTLGRDYSANVQILDTKVSSSHAMILFEKGNWWVYDLQSSNGTLLNKIETEASSLQDGDLITIGTSTIGFHFAEGTETVEPAVKESLGRWTKPSSEPASDAELVEELSAAYDRMRDQLSQVIVGQHDVIEQMLIAIFCRGHALLMGVPGLAKTLLVSTLSHVLDLGFKRIQFTPDLMPADITGTEVLDDDGSGKRSFRFVQGPIFSNLVLADEINRTPPKTQAALLEAMQEHHVTVGDKTYHLPEPFFVLATQNPIEQEGTYPLPEAQLDRFMFNIIVDYPSAAEEQQIIKQVTGNYKAKIETALNADDVLKLQQIVRRVPVADHVVEYAATLARASRPKQPDAPDFVQEMVAWGAGPRAGINMITAAKARAILQGRYHATTEDVKKVALPVLRHRILTTFNAEAAGVTSDDIVKLLLKHCKPRAELDV
ncbi:MAG: MoxR-like ATPase [Pseudoalteromonas tetraodonis]|jgi:MoxR-like ATPase